MSWFIDEDTLESIAIGAGILGTGGGGNPYLGKLRVRALLRQGRQVQVVGVDDLPDEAVVVSVGGIGAPTVGIERLPRGDEPVEALRALEAYANVQADAVISVEIGGGNSIVPMIVAAYTGLPVVDADGMGRAFPEVQMTSFFIYNVPCTPAVLCDSHSHTTIFDHIPDPHTLERMARVVTIQMGCTASFAMPVMSGLDVKRTAIPGTLALVRAVGDAVRRARLRHEDPAAATLQVTGGKIIFQGKIVNVDRQTSQGFARGRVHLSGMHAYQDQEMSIDIQNENLIAWSPPPSSPPTGGGKRGGEERGSGRRGEGKSAHATRGRPLVTVPDLICIIDMDSGEPITTELLRYGYRVTVLGIPCHPKMATPQALRFVGPRCFGYDVEYIPLA